MFGGNGEKPSTSTQGEGRLTRGRKKKVAESQNDQATVVEQLSMMELTENMELGATITKQKPEKKYPKKMEVGIPSSTEENTHAVESPENEAIEVQKVKKRRYRKKKAAVVICSSSKNNSVESWEADTGEVAKEKAKSQKGRKKNVIEDPPKDKGDKVTIYKEKKIELRKITKDINKKMEIPNSSVSLPNVLKIQKTNVASIGMDETEEQTESTVSDVRPESYKKKLFNQLITILDQVIKQSAPFDTVWKNISELYSKNDKKAFAEVLFRIMYIPFKDSESTPLLKFVQDIVVKIGCAKTGTNVTKEDKEFGGLNLRILRLMIQNHNDVNPVVRRRLVETAHKILESFLIAKEALGAKLTFALKGALFHRLRDKSTNVRVASVMALSCLQDETRQNSCPIAERLIFFMRCDPIPLVRKTVLDHMNFLQEDMQYLIGTVYDPHEVVREAAFRTLKKLPLSMFPPRAKEYVIKAGLSDKSNLVHRQTENLIHAWFKSLNGDIVKVLTLFTLVTERSIAEQILHVIFKNPDAVSFSKIDLSMFDDKLIPISALSEQKAFLWRFILTKFASTSYTRILEPSLGSICEYINVFLTSAQNTPTYGSILTELLQIILVITMEEGGRYILMDMMKYLTGFKYLQPVHVRYVVLLNYKCQMSDSDSDFLCLANDIMNGAREALEATPNSAENEESEDLTDEQTVSLKAEAGKLVYERYLLANKRQLLLDDKQTEKAAEFNIRIKTLEVRIQDIRVKLGLNLNSSFTTSGRRDSQIILDKEINESDKYPDVALELGICAVIIHMRRKRIASQEILNFMDAYTLDSLQSTSERVRSRFLELSTLVGLTNKNRAIQVMTRAVRTFIHESDDMKFVAINCIFDLMIAHGLDFFKSEELTSAVLDCRAMSDMFQKYTDPSATRIFLQYLIKLHETTLCIRKEIILGLMKLMSTGRVQSLSVFTSLMTLWINPINDGSPIFRIITYWLPNYTRQSIEYANFAADIIVPCCTKIFKSNKDSPLRNGDLDKFFEFIIHNTDQRVLTEIEKVKNVHVRIAMNILNEICKLGGDARGPLSVYVRALKGLNLNGLGARDHRRLNRRLKKIKEFSIKNKTTLVAFEAFIRYLKQFKHQSEPAEDIDDVSSECSAEDEVDMDEDLDYESEQGQEDDDPSDPEEESEDEDDLNAENETSYPVGEITIQKEDNDDSDDYDVAWLNCSQSKHDSEVSQADLSSADMFS